MKARPCIYQTFLTIKFTGHIHRYFFMIINFYHSNSRVHTYFVSLDIDSSNLPILFMVEQIILFSAANIFNHPSLDSTIEDLSRTFKT